MTETTEATIEKLRALRWQPKYNGFVPNPTAPDGGVDMWLLVDDQTGDTIVSLSVPKGRSDIAGYVAACCGNPVRWVTSMWKPDPRKDGVDDPDDVLGKEAREIADVMFQAYMAYADKQLPRADGKKQINGWAINDALSFIWYGFCGQLSHGMRGRLLFKFMQLATTDDIHHKEQP